MHHEHPVDFELQFDPWILSIFIVYFVVLIGIALFRARQLRNMSDFVLAGRNVSSFTTALSTGSSATSGWTILVFPAMAFEMGVSALWIGVWIVAATWLVWVLMAKRLRRYTLAATDSLTSPEFFEKRFGDHTGTLRTIAAVITIFFVFFYVSSGFIAGAKLLENIFQVHHPQAVVITAIAVASYTLIGGFLAVSRTDVFQAFIMLSGFVIIVVTLFAISSDPFGPTASDTDGFWNPFTDVGGTVITPFYILSSLGFGIGAFGAQRILQRFMAIESEKSIKPSRNMSMIWVTMTFLLSLSVGLFAYQAMDEAGALDTVLNDPERLYYIIVDTLFHPVVIGLLLTAVIAAVMSTADSQLLLASAVATDDLPFIRRFAYSLQATSRVWLGRGLLVLIGAVAALYSIYFPDSVANLVVFAWGGMGAAFGPVTLLALYWRRFNFWGALAAMVSGTLLATLWGVMSGGPDFFGGPIWDMNPATLAFFLTFPIAYLATILTAQPSEEVTKLFDEVTAAKPELRSERAV